MSTRLIIDTDPGVDDAMAILMALAVPELEVVGLTTVFGNAATEVTTVNALRLLEVAGRTDIPVARGADRPLTTDYLGPVPFVHGHNGLGDAAVADPARTPVAASAARFIVDTVRAAPGEITLLAVGPLTNLALAIEVDPEIVGLVDQVVVMGGNAFVPGNATPVAEANINNDPEAADLVFGAGWPITMVGLDVTHRVNLRGEAIDRITSREGHGAALLRAALPLYRGFFEDTNGIDGIFVHDPTAVAFLLDPDAFEIGSWPVRVETESFSRGKTWPNLGDTDDESPPAWRGRPLVDICTGVDADRVLRLVAAGLAGGA